MGASGLTGVLEVYIKIKSWKTQNLKTKTVEWYKHLITSYELTSEV